MTQGVVLQSLEFQTYLTYHSWQHIIRGIDATDKIPKVHKYGTEKLHDTADNHPQPTKQTWVHCTSRHASSCTDYPEHSCNKYPYVYCTGAARQPIVSIKFQGCGWCVAYSKATNWSASAMNSTAKVPNSTVNGTKLTAKVSNSIAKTCTLCLS